MKVLIRAEPSGGDGFSRLLPRDEMGLRWCLVFTARQNHQEEGIDAPRSGQP